MTLDKEAPAGRQRGFILADLWFALVAVLVIGSWAWNAVKLTYCDFEPNYRCEFIHGAGLVVPPLSIVTVWFGDDGGGTTGVPLDGAAMQEK